MGRTDRHHVIWLPAELVERIDAACGGGQTRQAVLAAALEAAEARLRRSYGNRTAGPGPELPPVDVRVGLRDDVYQEMIDLRRRAGLAGLARTSGQVLAEALDYWQGGER